MIALLKFSTAQKYTNHSRPNQNMSPPRGITMGGGGSIEALLPGRSRERGGGAGLLRAARCARATSPYAEGGTARRGEGETGVGETGVGVDWRGGVSGDKRGARGELEDGAGLSAGECEREGTLLRMERTVSGDLGARTVGRIAGREGFPSGSRTSRTSRRKRKSRPNSSRSLKGQVGQLDIEVTVHKFAYLSTLGMCNFKCLVYCLLVDVRAIYLSAEHFSVRLHLRLGPFDEACVCVREYVSLVIGEEQVTYSLLLRSP